MNATENLMPSVLNLFCKTFSSYLAWLCSGVDHWYSHSANRCGCWEIVYLNFSYSARFRLRRFASSLLHVARTISVPLCDIFRLVANFESSVCIYSFYRTGFVHYPQILLNLFCKWWFHISDEYSWHHNGWHSQNQLVLNKLLLKVFFHFISYKHYLDDTLQST